jgi:hypothetical protein
LVKRTEEGFANTAAVLSLTLTRNGRAVASSVFSSMEDLVLPYRLGKEGTLLGISGYEKLAEAMRAKLPEPPARSTIQLPDYDSLR